MNDNLRNVFMKSLRYLPTKTFDVVFQLFSNSRYNDLLLQVENNRVSDFFLKLANDEKRTTLFNDLKKNNHIMVISKGEYDYEYFNVCFFNNILSLIVYAMYRNSIPVIEINANSKEKIQWEWYFNQPYKALWGEEYILRGRRNICSRTVTPIKPSFTNAFNRDSTSSEIWAALYKRFFSLNKKTQQYVNNELQILRGKKTLGILLRGTDYISTKPKGHPIQPTFEEVFEKANELINTHHYTHVYIATEEKKLFDKCIEAFGKEKVLSNTRVYYDEIYYSLDEGSEIKDVHFARNNDNYKKGLEYLSSLVILSKCDGIVGGNCGGMLASLMLSEEYEDCYIFNEGLY